MPENDNAVQTAADAVPEQMISDAKEDVYKRQGERCVADDGFTDTIFYGTAGDWVGIRRATGNRCV